MKTSPSSLAREVACPSSALLPQADSISPPALRGTALHAFLCAIGTGMGKDIALLMLPEEWRETANTVDLGTLPPIDPKTGVPEIAIAWNIATGETRELGRGGKLNREEIRALARDGEMVGTVDWLALDESSVHVRDWKSGWSAVDRAEVNRQLGAYAVMAAKHFGRDRAHVAITRLLDNGESWSDTATLDAMDLDEAEASIRTHVRQMAEREELFRSKGILPKLIEGSHCKFCGAFKFCPAKGQLIQAVFSVDKEPPRILSALPVPLTADAAAKLWAKIELAEDLLKKLKTNVRELAEREPLKLPNGKVLAQVEKSQSRINPAKAKEVMAPAFYESVVKRVETITKDAVYEQLKATKKPEEKITHVSREFYAELEKVGAMKTSFWKSVEEVSPDSKRLAANNEDKAA